VLAIVAFNELARLALPFSGEVLGLLGARLPAAEIQ
jgi:hypothetical protein